MNFLRIWTEIDVSEIKNSILTVDDKFGFCPGCKEIGIKLEKLKDCPKCGRNFKYVSSRESKGPNGHKFVERTRKNLLLLKSPKIVAGRRLESTLHQYY